MDQGTEAKRSSPLRHPERERARALPALLSASGWSMVLALGCTTVLSYGTTHYLFDVLEVPPGCA